MKVTVCFFEMILAFVPSLVTHCLNLACLFFVRSHLRILGTSFICPFIRSFIRSFLCSFIILCVRFVRWFSYSSVLSFNRSFVFSSVILCAPRFVYFCGILFVNQISCLCEGLRFLSINSFLRLDHQPLFGKGARAPPLKVLLGEGADQTRESGRNRAYSSPVAPLT